MPLSWNEIKSRAIKFSKEWETAEKENASSQPFWIDFFNVFGISQRRVSTFEHSVKKLGNKDGRIDLFWKGRLIIEHKSKGKNLDKAFQQAIDYFPGLNEDELPKYILVSDFENFRLYDLEENTQHNFLLSEFHKNIKLFGFIAGYQKQVIHEVDPINIKAAEKMGKLHDLLKENGYTGHELEVYLIRLLFMLFADDTGIFEKDILWHFIENHTSEDGSDLAIKLAQLFQVLDTPTDKRQKNLDENYTQFPYINGKLFEENIRLAAFDSKMRKILLESCAMDWSLISPAIFGSLFQSIMDKTERRNLGAHYTSEKNILKVIKPLFLDDLWAEFEKIKGNSKKLALFHKKLGELKFFDPACGSGNFIIIAYRELRLLELAILEQTYKGQQITSIEQVIWLNIDQFYGIEIDEWAARIAELAMWLIDHQMNMLISQKFGKYFVRIPLKKSANITHGNSLQINWNNLIHGSYSYVTADKLNVQLVSEPQTHYETLNVKAKNVNFIDEKELLKEDKKHQTKFDYIMGNPPFIGAAMKNTSQTNDMNKVFSKNVKHGKLDYVAAWYYLAAKYILNSSAKAAFVSTNSVVQGEQVSILWDEITTNFGIEIFFAHRTFEWNNDAKGKAAVHVIVVGFESSSRKNKVIFDYENIKGEPTSLIAKNINPYLIDSPNIFINKKRHPISNVPILIRGNIPYDNGNLLLSKTEKIKLLNDEPLLKPFIKRYGGAYEMLNNKWRYCLWLVNVSPNIIKQSKFVTDRITKCKLFREKSTTISVKSKSDTPSIFGDIRQPSSDYILIPRVSSHRRKYLPIGFISKETILADSSYGLPNATLFHFGILHSIMHNSWLRLVGGKLKSDYRYSNTIVYNNYPFPKNITDKQKERVEKAAQKVLDTRAEFPNSSLADLYDPITMPPSLVKAHNQLDKAVDLCYRPQAFTNERARIEFLFDLYSQYVTPLQAQIDKQKKKRKPRKK